MSVSDEGLCEKVSFYTGWRRRAEEFGIPPRSEESPLGDSWSDGTGRRGDPRNETLKYRVQEWKRRQEGREAPPRNVSMTFLTDMIKKGICRGRNTRCTLRIGERQEAETNADDSN